MASLKRKKLSLSEKYKAVTEVESGYHQQNHRGLGKY